MKILETGSGTTVLFKATDSCLTDVKYVVNCGAFEEKRSKDHGLCHALEHMVLAGTKTHKCDELYAAFRRIGAITNGFTTHTLTTYEANVGTENFEEAFSLLADCVYRPEMNLDKWKLEKEAVLAEIQENMDDLESQLEDIAFSLALGNKYHSPLGTSASVQKATLKDLLYFKNRYYGGKNIVLTVAGNWKEKELLNILNKYDSNKFVPRNKRLPLKFRFDSSPSLLRVRGLTQAWFYWLYPLSFKQSYQNRLIASIIDTALHEHLFKELREKRGMCYHVDVETHHTIPGVAFQSVATSVDAKYIRAVKKVSKAVLENISDVITPERLQECKSLVSRSLIDLGERSSGITALMLTAYETGVKEDPFKLAYDTVMSLDIDTIKRFAGKYYSSPKKLLQIRAK